MVIQIDGINTQNKGAELMLVAILEELERRFPGATVYINPDSKLNLEMLPKFNLLVKMRPGFMIGRYFNYLAYKLKIRNPIRFFSENYSPKNVDLILDSSGFKYSDQWDRSNEWIQDKAKYNSIAKKNNSRIVFLTQAFGPFETINGKKSIEMLSNSANLIYARESISYSYLIEAGAEGSKVKKSCDFTFKVNGVLPDNFKCRNNYVTIIPNHKMMSHGGDNVNSYLDFLINSVNYFRECNFEVILLNHEGEKDLSLCELVNERLEYRCEIVTDLSAKQIKGVIGNSKLVISSRFHGVASALSQGVPCLATSWNHKYEMLFNDFSQKNRILRASDSWYVNKEKIEELLNDIENTRKGLMDRKYSLITQIESMWNEILK